jgi:hypothetical protein
VKKKILRRWQFLKAITIAARYGIERFTLPEIWFAVKSVWRAIRVDKSGNISHSKWVHRMKCCYKCPVFDRRLKTCGSPFSTQPQLGCYCFEPIAAKREKKLCWLDSNSDGSLDYGWKEN